MIQMISNASTAPGVLSSICKIASSSFKAITSFQPTKEQVILCGITSLAGLGLYAIKTRTPIQASCNIKNINASLSINTSA